MKAAVYLLRRRGGSALFGAAPNRHGLQKVWLRDYVPPDSMPKSILLDWLLGVFMEDCKSFTDGKTRKLTHLAVQASGSYIGNCPASVRLAHERSIGRFSQIAMDVAYLKWGELVELREVLLTPKLLEETQVLSREHRLSDSEGPGLRALALGVDAGFLRGTPRPWRHGGQPTPLGVALEELRIRLNV